MTNIEPLKIVLLGDQGTGKTNLWSRLAKNHFNPNYEPTTGMNFASHALMVADQRVTMDILDLVGDKKWRCLADGLLRDADGILLVYDISNRVTFKNLVAWLKLIREASSPKTIIKLVGNKNDLQSMVPRKEADQFAADNGLSYIETSALNESHVRLAFESIAQEINVATHSLSEPSTDSFVQKEPKEKASPDIVQEKPFQVVLIDIEQAASCETIVCVEKPLEEADLEFIAISYRWGEVKEQMIDTNLGYMASITSFHLNDFYQLCRDMRREADLHSIKYVWVDAICVDQINQVRRKATIYQMSNIYHRAAYILAVPDLHLKYLRNNDIFDFHLSLNARKFSDFLYYLLHGKSDPLVHVTENWFDQLGIPKDKMTRKYLTRNPGELFTKYLQVYNFQDATIPCDYGCEHNCYGFGFLDCHDTPNAMLNCVQYAINKCHDHSKDTTMVYENNDCALCTLQMDMCKHQRESLEYSEVILDSNQKWLTYVLRELTYDNYRSLVDKRAKDIADLMAYLESLIKDWSSRVWVISELNIAKTKPSCKMKFWFLSLHLHERDLEKLDFFELDFGKEDYKLFPGFVSDYDKAMENDFFPGSDVPVNHVTFNAFACYAIFYAFTRTNTQQSFLEMMLDSKASRNEDRFYAILPSTEYKNKLTSREEVSSWQIDTLVSVKLKLYELMTTKDKLKLLYWMSNSSSTLACAFPAFANIDLTYYNVLPVEERDEENRPCNFELNNNATLRLVPPMENGIHLYKLHLAPKMYYAIHDETAFTKDYFVGIFNENKRLWETFEMRYQDDDWAFVYIPMYIRNMDRRDLHKDIGHITLFGNFKESKWLLCSNIFGTLHIKYATYLFPWKRYDNSDGDISFDIY